MRKSILRRMITFGLAGVMAMSMITMGRAGYRGEQIELGGNGYADCYINCDASGAEAQTIVYANYNAYYVMAKAELELDALLSTGATEGIGSDVDDTEADYGGYASAAVYVEDDLAYNIGTYAWSYHDANIDGETGSCVMTEEY